MRAARSDQTTMDKPHRQRSSAARSADSRRPGRSGRGRGIQLRAAGTEGTKSLVEAGPRPGLDLTVTRHRLVPRRLEIFEPGVRLLDLEQLLRFPDRPGESVVVILHGRDSQDPGRTAVYPRSRSGGRSVRPGMGAPARAGRRAGRAGDRGRPRRFPRSGALRGRVRLRRRLPRQGLDDRTRQLAAISALTALGGAEPQLEYHIGIALNVGVEPREIVETIIHLAPFLGFARTLNAARSAKRVFAAPRDPAADGLD